MSEKPSHNQVVFDVPEDHFLKKVGFSAPKAGDVVLTNVQFTDTFEIKKRPALVLFEELDNVVVAGITSNLEMEGIPLTKKEGAVKESVIKLNYIFTVSRAMVEKVLFSLSNEKKKKVFDSLVKKLSGLR